MKNLSRSVICCMAVAVALVGVACAGPSPRSLAKSCDPNCSGQPETRDFGPEDDGRIAALEAEAAVNPRAAYDLALRYFRGDGVRRDSYKALTWMRSAGERGDLDAQKALGRLYLTGLEEMGRDPMEAQTWLSLAASRGDAESKQLLTEAEAARRSELEEHKWLSRWRPWVYRWWYSGYPYYGRWYGGRWYYH